MTTNKDFQAGDIITVTPQAKRAFRVILIDSLGDELIYVEPVDGLSLAQWYPVTYAKRAAPQGGETT